MSAFGDVQQRRGSSPVRLGCFMPATLGMLLMAGCSSKAADNALPPPPEVSVAQVLSQPIRQWDEFNGRVVAVQTVGLRPRVSGYIDHVDYREGDAVRKGQVLFTIDQKPYQAALDRAQAALDRARSAAMLAATESRRAQTLVEAQAISREDFDTRSAATAQSQAALHSAESTVALARLDLDYTQVRSPIDGRAGVASLTAGNLVQADTTLLTSIVSVAPMYVYFEADEQSFLRYGALARDGKRQASGNPVRVGLADEAGYPHDGYVDFIDNHVDPTTGTVRARAVLPNADGVLTPGLFARVQLQGSAEFTATLIDDKAVLTDQDRKYVYVLGPNNTAVRRDVTLGRTAEGLRIVTSGLTAADKVIVNGLEKVFAPGMAVAPKLVAMTASAAPPKVAAR